ncbi:unnamed protein product [Mesocestoides corti]|uniref:Uncharacterized protein n=1 Tax=Mesocestoides corti TaxID=53468 RepID=A0A0R3UQT0_MESCO|nr:unnamed protein product [Mesocestoides corti]
MTTATDKLELSEEEIADDKMTALRTRALNLALQRRLFVSPASTTKMEDPRYMARSYHSNGAVIEYEWISRVVTTDGYLDEDGSYVSVRDDVDQLKVQRGDEMTYRYDSLQ